MANPSSTEFPYEAEITFRNKYLKVGKHIAVLPIDATLSMHIGRVTAYFCYYETMFHALIEQMLAAAERSEPNWQRRAFTKRTELARELLSAVTFPAADEAAKRIIRKCLDTAADLQWGRNAVVHGTYEMSVAAKSSDATFTAYSTHKGKSVSISLNPDTLEKLWHDIAHLCGEFIEMSKLVGDVSGLAHTFPDKQLIDMLREMDRKNLPTQQMP